MGEARVIWFGKAAQAKTEGALQLHLRAGPWALAAGTAATGPRGRARSSSSIWTALRSLYLRNVRANGELDADLVAKLAEGARPAGKPRNKVSKKIPKKWRMAKRWPFPKTITNSCRIAIELHIPLDMSHEKKRTWALENLGPANWRRLGVG